ncbi:MAG: FAD-dependent oxidoreductase [Cyanobacteria bacterium NC_groundwater_1444_Ag_S-0.65um_54_12]|nr:FAD-dependent oxidoreductase [Cyanobacteria bacterium NC_groundwater_1444_Ag_S-0.65um_54_12]
MDFDLLVIGNETESVLAGVAAARAGAQTGLLVRPDQQLGGLLTSGGLAYVDRDQRHLLPPTRSPHDGIFAEFLARAGVRLVALDPASGERALSTMLQEAGVTVLSGNWDKPRSEGMSLCSLRVSDVPISARFFLDATPDGDLLEALGEPLAFGFSEYQSDRLLAVSPLPRVLGVTPQEIVETYQRLAKVTELQDLRRQAFGERRFLDIECGEDYLLLGPPDLALAFMRWRADHGFAFPLAFAADGFNVAILGPADTSWNGLLYFSGDPATLLEWSRQGADRVFRREAEIFEEFLQKGLGWRSAKVLLPDGIYVRQTRHAVNTCLRLSLSMIASDLPVRSVGTFCYYPDFRGLPVPAIAKPLVAPVALDAGLLVNWRNVAIASRAAGYTPLAHSLCRLVQYNVTLGAALGVAAALAASTLAAVPTNAIKTTLARLGLLADDPAGLGDNSAKTLHLRCASLLQQEEGKTTLS